MATYRALTGEKNSMLVDLLWKAVEYQMGWRTKAERSFDIMNVFYNDSKEPWVILKSTVSNPGKNQQRGTRLEPGWMAAGWYDRTLMGRNAFRVVKAPLHNGGLGTLAASLLADVIETRSILPVIGSVGERVKKINTVMGQRHLDWRCVHIDENPTAQMLKAPEFQFRSVIFPESDVYPFGVRGCFVGRFGESFMVHGNQSETVKSLMRNAGMIIKRDRRGQGGGHPEIKEDSYLFPDE